MSIKVSVCVPVYNAEKYIDRCINSLLKQTLREIELIFVNDGSTDRSLDILIKYQERNQSIKVVNQSNAGLGGARNSALKLARGEYIGFLDADDFVDPTMYEKLYACATEIDADIAMCNVKLYPRTSRTKRIWFKPYKGEITPDFLNRNTQPWNKIVSSSLIKGSGFEFYKQNGDGMFITLMLKADKITSIDACLYNYRVGHKSMSTDYKLSSFIVSYESSKEQRRELDRTKYSGVLDEYFDYRIIYSLIQLLTIAALEKNKPVYLEYRNRLRESNMKSNMYIATILKREFGPMKTFVMTTIVPSSYLLTSILVNLQSRVGKL